MSCVLGYEPVPEEGEEEGVQLISDSSETKAQAS